MRVAMRGMASGYHEVVSCWDYDELLAANEILDLIDDADEKAADRAARANRR